MILLPRPSPSYVDVHQRFLTLRWIRMVFPIVALVVALFIAIVITPIARRVAIRFDLVDHPDSHRKLHRQPIALCGGIAVLMSLILAVGLMLGIRDDFAQSSWTHLHETIALAVASVAIVVLGVLDDRIGLRGRQKLTGQILICLSLIAFGFTIPEVSLFGWTIELGVLMVPVTLGWLLLAINSVNLIDGADGLCSSVGWIACASLASVGWMTGHGIESMVAASMAGGLLGFLYYNLPPAKVFLGDAGSMLVGLVVGVLSLRCSSPEGSAIPILLPLAILSIPFFDSMMAIVRRTLTGRSVFTVDRGHLHHNLMRLGIRNQWLVVVISLLAGVTSGSAVLSIVYQSEWISLGAILVSLGTLVATRAFGFAEFELLGKRLSTFVKGSLSLKNGLPDLSREHRVRLQGSREWEIVWETLVEFAEKHRLAKIALDLNMPWLHEGFHANWHIHAMPEFSERWMARLPIDSDGRILGRIEVAGYHRQGNSYLILAHLGDMLADLRPQIEAVLHGLERERTGLIPPNVEIQTQKAARFSDN